MIKKKVMVEVGDLEKLKAAVEVYSPDVSEGSEHIGILVELAKRVVAAEEKIQGLIEYPVDIDSY